jgi:hypothetical protein
MTSQCLECDQLFLSIKPYGFCDEICEIKYDGKLTLEKLNRERIIYQEKVLVLEHKIELLEKTIKNIILKQ